LTIKPERPAPGEPIRMHRSHPDDGKRLAKIDAYKTKYLDLGDGWTRIWTTSGEMYFDIQGNGRMKNDSPPG